MDSSSAADSEEDTERSPAFEGSGPTNLGASPSVRLFATLAVVALVATYVAAQVDFLRRHKPGIAPLRYWLPQARLIWGPGLALALVCALTAFALHRWRRRT
jgi:hypothetical protein